MSVPLAAHGDLAATIAASQTAFGGARFLLAYADRSTGHPQWARDVTINILTVPNATNEASGEVVQVSSRGSYTVTYPRLLFADLDAYRAFEAKLGTVQTLVLPWAACHLSGALVNAFGVRYRRIVSVLLERVEAPHGVGRGWAVETGARFRKIGA